MPKPFVDHGMLYYAGCTDCLIFGNESDDTFWFRLCIWDESVYVVTLNYIASINQFVTPPYVYGTDIKIYGGTTSAYLGN